MSIRRFITDEVSPAPLAVFRVLFGFIMLVSIVRFALRGWIHDLYVEPSYHFTWYGFDWIVPPGETGIYLLFLIMGVAALFIMLGYLYRPAAAVFFLLFTWVELIDKTWYLNHYYFVSIISFLLVLVPAHRHFSLDVLRKPRLQCRTVPAWTINIFLLQLGIVYFYAGVAKLNPDWLLEAMPLRLWLPANAHLPVIGPFLEMPAAAWLFSWAGALYDLTIVFFLLWSRTRIAAYLTVVLFHAMTAALFQIGMFPWIMILSTLIFFPADFHRRLIAAFRKISGRLIPDRLAAGRPETARSAERREGPAGYRPGRKTSMALAAVLLLHFSLQLLLPLRFTLYPGDVFWTEQGYRFSWRVMLMEKAGHATFHVRDPETGRRWQVDNREYLTPGQEKMMATQPDMILQFAHFLEGEYADRGMEGVEITAESRVTLNGRSSRLMVDPEVDLTAVERGFGAKRWILPVQRDARSWLSGERGTGKNPERGQETGTVSREEPKQETGTVNREEPEEGTGMNRNRRSGGGKLP